MIIGISGLSNSGKDTLAGFLVQDHGFTVLSLADPLKRICRDIFEFTDDQLWGPSQSRNAPDERYPRTDPTVQQARDIVANMPGKAPSSVQAWARKSPDEYLTPRYALQRLGTEWGRDCYYNVWVEYAMRVAQRLISDPDDGSVPYYDKKDGLTYKPLGPYGMPLGVAIPDVRFRNEVDGIRAAGGKVIRLRRPGSGLQGLAGLHASEVEQAGIPDSAFDHVIENEGSLNELRAKAADMLRCLRP